MVTKKTSYRELNFDFPKTSIRQTAWYKKIRKIIGYPAWPLVASCCGGSHWVNAMYESKPGSVDYCCDCKAVCKVDFMSLDQFNKIVGIPVTAEEFKSMWDPATGPKEGYL